jgi:hypothetical protein
MQLYLAQDHPTADRLFVLEGGQGTCLTFRKAQGRAPTVQLALVPRDELDLTRDGVRRLGGKVYGCLGLLSIANDIFLCVIDAANQIGSLARDEHISRILTVSFHCVTSSTYDAFSTTLPSDFTAAGDIDMSYNASAQRDAQQAIEHPCAGIRKYLSSGHLYFSSSFDLSSRLQARIERGTSDVGVYDDRFTWNSFAIEPLLSFRDRLDADERTVFDQAGFVVLAIQGFASVVELHMAGSTSPVTISLISRLGWKRAGTRFLTRGLDDEGHVANFVESETIVRTAALTFSYVQIRGSVPGAYMASSALNKLSVYAQSSGSSRARRRVVEVASGMKERLNRPAQPFVQKMQITRPQIASQPAFDRHFAGLLESYPNIHILNLLGGKDHEAALTNAYADHLAHLRSVVDPSRLGWTAFDLHARSRGAGGIENVRHELFSENAVAAGMDGYGYCMASNGRAGEKDSLIQGQEGAFRTNCLDCLDRTNLVQDILSRVALEHFVLNTNPTWLGSEQLWSAHRILWAEVSSRLVAISRVRTFIRPERRRPQQDLRRHRRTQHLFHPLRPAHPRRRLCRCHEIRRPRHPGQLRRQG